LETSETSQHSLLLQEPVDHLAVAHEHDVLAVDPDVERSPQPAQRPHQCEHEELLRVEGEVHVEARLEVGRDGVGAVEPHRQQPEDGGAADGGEEPAPVVPHREVHRRYLDAEEDAADGGGEAAAHPDGASRRQHLRGATLVLVDALEAGYELAQEGGGDAGDVDEGAFLAQGEAAPQGGGQTDHFGHEGAERQVLFEGDSPQDRLHLGDARA
jgi:hypothetical protein